MDYPQGDMTVRMKDLHTVQPNMLDMASSMLTRDKHNHAPELGSFQGAKGECVTWSTPLDVNKLIK